MPTPTKKHPAIENLLGSLSPSPIGRTESIESNLCSWCGKSAKDFRDELSEKEYTISGLCQSCQDDTFGGAE